MTRQIKLIVQNPRSTSMVEGDYFTKTSSELNLSKEAMEIERCKRMGIQTEHVKPLEFIKFDAALNQLVTRYIPNAQSLYNKLSNGTSLIGLLRGKKQDPDLLISRVEELGQWLKMYHDSTDYPDHAQDAGYNLLNMFKEKINFVRQNKILDEDFLSRLDEHFSKELTAFQSANNTCIKICRIHSDFNSYNIIINEDMTIHIVDFGDTRIGISLEDVGRFYEHIWAMSQTSKRRKKIFTEALSVFLKAYGIEQETLDMPFFRSIRALNAIIHLISEYYNRQFLHGSIITKLELRRITNKSLMWISREISTPYKILFSPLK